MAETRIIHHREAPTDWQERPEEFVYIGRAVQRKGLKASLFANPFTVEGHGREEALRMYEDYARRAIASSPDSGLLESLSGKTLVCWCAPKGGVTRHDKPWCCHGQVLAQLAHELNEPDLSQALEASGSEFLTKENKGAGAVGRVQRG